MKKLLLAVLLPGVIQVGVAARQPLTLRNADVHPHNFNIQYADGSACGNRQVRLGAGRTTLLEWGADCPLESISTQEVRENMMHEKWNGKKEIVFYPGGFYPDSKRLVTLTNHSGKDHAFWVQYAQEHPCKSGMVQLKSRGRDASVRIWSGGDCPLMSINVGRKLDANGLIAKIRDEWGSEKEEWKGQDIHFGNRFYANPGEITLINGLQYWPCDFEIKYRKGSACSDRTVRDVSSAGGSVRIFAGPGCPLESIRVPKDSKSTLIIDDKWKGRHCIKYTGKPYKPWVPFCR